MKESFVRPAVLILLVLSFFPSSFAVGSAMHPIDLRCEFLSNPLGIDRMHPRLSWKLSAPASAKRGLMQTAYQIQVAGSELDLSSGTREVWDSGRVDSNQSNLVKFEGKALQSRQMCWWRVRIW